MCHLLVVQLSSRSLSGTSAPAPSQQLIPEGRHERDIKKWETSLPVIWNSVLKTAKFRTFDPRL